jgi:hypothetical protein
MTTVLFLVKTLIYLFITTRKPILEATQSTIQLVQGVKRPECLSGKLLLAFTSTVILGSESCETHDHILLLLHKPPRGTQHTYF